MRYGIFADIHSNEEAFDAVIERLAVERVDSYLCAGDFVGYGASACESIAKVSSLAVTAVAGNHDWAAVDKFPLDDFNRFAKAALFWTKDALGEQERAFLSSLTLTCENEDYFLVHGSVYQPQRFQYVLEESAARLSFGLLRRRVCFLGHSHIPGVFIEDESRAIRYSREFPVRVEEQKKYIVNVGSVGQPRDGDNRASCAVYDTEEKRIRLLRVAYNVASARRRIIEAGLPAFLGDRLLKGN